MTMFYDDRDMNFLAAQAYQREIDAQKKIIEEGKRLRKAAVLSKKPVPVKKPAVRHA